MSKNLSGAFFTTKSLNGENEVDINNLIAESAQIDDLSCSQLEIGTLNVIAKFGAVDNSINLLEQSIDDLSSNLDISCANIDVSLNANINNLTATGTKDFTTGLLNLGSTIMNSNIVGNSHNIAGLNKITASEGNIIDLSCANLDVSLNANFDDITANGTKDFTTGLLQMGSTIMNSNIVGNNHNIAGLNNITSSQGTIDTLTNTNFNTIDISCRHLHIENEFSNSRYITFEDDYSRDIASFTGRLISGINADCFDLSMIGYSASGNKEILLSTDPDTNSYIDVANFGIGTKTPTTKFEVNGNIKGTDLTITNDITCNNDITCDNDLDVDGIATFKDVVVSDTGTTGGSIDLTGELTINTPAFYGGTSGLKVNNVSYFNSNVGIGIDAASNPLHIYEATGSGSIDNASTGALVLEHGNTDGLSRILFKSANGTTDFGAIQFNSSVDAGEENCVLSIVSGNDGGTQDQIRLRTNEANRMYIMGNGNIGINEASPEGKLHIYEDTGNHDINSSTQGSLIFQHGNSNGNSRILFKSANNNSDFGAIHYLSGSSGNEQSILYLIAGNDTAGNNQDQIRFRTDENDRMTIDGNGSVGIRTTDPTHTLDINGTMRCRGRFYINTNESNTSARMYVSGSTNANGTIQIRSENSGKRVDGMAFFPINNGNHIINFQNTSNGTRGKIRGNGSGNVAYDTNSDRRLKTNIEDMDNQLDNIMNLQPRQYNWIEDNEKGYGFIAQEVHQIYPQFREDFDQTYCCDNPNYHADCPCDASGNMWYYGLDYGLFTPYIIKAFQEYKIATDAKISELESRIQALEEI